MAWDPTLRAHQEWLGYIQPAGLVVSPAALVAAGCVPDRNISAHQETLRGLLTGDPPRLLDFPSFTREFLGWQESDLAGAPGGPPLPESLSVALPNEHDTLRPTYAVPDPGAEGRFLLLVSVVPPGADLDDAGARNERGHADGWHASPQARLERLLRETGVPAGLLASGDALRLVALCLGPARRNPQVRTIQKGLMDMGRSASTRRRRTSATWGRASTRCSRTPAATPPRPPS